jgi:hypothetical protein
MTTLVELKISAIGSNNKPVKVTVIESDTQGQAMEMLLLPGADPHYLHVNAKSRVEFNEEEIK